MRIFKLRQVEVVILIYHQIPVTNLQGNELKLEGRIHNWILEVKGLIPCLFCIPSLSILSKRHFWTLLASYYEFCSVCHKFSLCYQQ